MRSRQLALLALGACYSANPPLGSPCSAIGECPNGQVCLLSAASPTCIATVTTGTWGPPTQITLAGTGDDDDPTLTDDLLIMYFNRDSDIYVTTRATANDPWAPPMIDDQLSSSADETTPEMSGDGLVMFQSSERDGGMGGYDIWISTRASVTAAWSTPVVVPELSSPEDDNACAPRDDLLEVVQSSDRGASGTNDPTDLWLSDRTSRTGAWPKPIRLAISDGSDDAPFPSADGLELYFADSPNGDQDLYVARRATLDDDFGPPERIDELDSSDDDDDPWVSPDGHHIFFSRSTATTSTLWESER